MVRKAHNRGPAKGAPAKRVPAKGVPAKRVPAKGASARARPAWNSTLDAGADALCLVDPQGSIVRANGTFATLVGRTPEEVVGEICCALVHGRKRHPVGCPLPKALKTKAHQEAEYPLGDRWVRAAVHPIFDEAGTFTGAVQILADITERKRAEEAVRESEERYRHALDVLPDPVFVKDEQHRWTMLNDALCQFVGYPRDQLLGKSDFDFFPREQAEVFWAKDEEVFASGEENINEEYLTDSSGTRHVISTKKSVYRDSRTGKQILVGVIRDVTEGKRIEEELHRYRERLEELVQERTTELEAANERLMREADERKLAEQALQESELQFRALAETSSVGILLAQGEYFTYANPAAARITGYGVGELLAMKFWGTVHPDFRELVKARAAARLAGTPEVPSRYEVKIVTKAGTERWLDLTSGAISLQGRPALVVTVADVTEERRLQQLQTAIYEISEATQTAGSLDDLFRSIHAIIGRLMAARNFYIALYDPAAELISFPYFMDEEDQPPEARRPGRGLTEYILRAGKPLLATPEVFEDLVRRGEVESMGAPSIDWLGVPLTVGERTIGVLVVQTYAEGVRYGEREKEILVFVSRQVALAIERKRAEDALRESEGKYKALIETTHTGYLILDAQGRVIDANPEYVGLTGHGTLAEIVGRGVTEWTAAHDLERNAAEVKKCIEHGFVRGLEIDYVDRRGVITPIEVNAKVIGSGASARILSLCRDITERKRAQDLLAATNERLIREAQERTRAEELRAAIYQISEAANQAESLENLFPSIHSIVGRLMSAKNLYIALYDTATNLISFPYFVDDKDATPEPFPLGKGMTSYVIKTARPLLAKPGVLAELQARGEITRLGSDSIDWLGVPLKVQDRVIGVLAVQSYVGDVRYTKVDEEVLSYVSAQVAQAIERKRAEEALWEGQERLRQLADATFEGIAITEQGRVIDGNNQLARMFRCALSDMVGRAVADFVAPESRPLVEQHIKAGSGESYEHLAVRPDGTAFPVGVRARTMSYRGHDVRVTALRDLTEQKLLEKSFLQAQKMEAVGRLAGGIAHDFNNVLQALLSLSQALPGQMDEAERFAATAAELQEQVKRGAALTRRLLLFSRAEPPRLERLDLNELVRQFSGWMRRLLPENIVISMDLAARPIALQGDSGQLEQVLMNLAVNAGDAMPRGGRLGIRTQVQDDQAVLEVADEGSGMTEEVKARVFEPFFSTKEASKGTGLGLSVVHGIVTGHGGRVELDSTVGRGSIFRVFLPIAAGAGAVAEPAKGDAQTAPLAVGGGERVLLVEDEPGAREGLVQILTMLGYRVTAIGTRAEANALAAEPAFDVLLTDLMLPDGFGGDLAASLKGRWPGMRIVLMSGYAQDETLRRRIVAGEVRFLQKPFGMEILARELRAALDEPANSEGG